MPHPPRLVKEIEDPHEPLKSEAMFRQVRQHVEKAEPDVIIEVDSDHFVNFFYNNVPAFCLGLAEESEGPQEIWCAMSHTFKGHVPMAQDLLSYGIGSNFDLAAAHELRLDHSIMIPLHSLNPGMEIPVVPLYVNGFAAPLPNAPRCFSLGQMIRGFVDQWGGNKRIAIIASGAFAQDVGGPLRGWIDEEWVDTVSGFLEEGKYETLAGAVGDTLPLFVETDNGTAYGVWELDK